VKYVTLIVSIACLLVAFADRGGQAAQPKNAQSAAKTEIEFDAAVSRTAFLGFIAQGALHCGKRSEEWSSHLLDAATGSLTMLTVASFSDDAGQFVHMHWALMHLTEQADDGRRLTPEGCIAFSVPGALDMADGIVASR
jgi:hypothetical protein